MIHSQNGKDTLMVSPQPLTAAATVSGIMDCIGGDYATIRCMSKGITFPSGSSSGCSITLESSDDTNASNFATITAVRSGIKTACQVRYEVDLKTTKRYLRTSFGGGTAGVTNDVTTVACIGTLTRLGQLPSNTTAMQTGGTVDAVIIV